ncbi:hypothetical protein DFJ43DRAFT_1155285 [Lentinula guzmanii]|uniref:Uncharacterized protein n=1 Tax=Lentinula guzmanii TaxID=2804957 RepID=A0AA38N058_9AGAR|nr:hypothetical protein DFJ43DRAFT_1155285 [Lentinula guzmanii]
MSVPARDPISPVQAAHNRAEKVEKRRQDLSEHHAHYLAANTAWHVDGRSQILVKKPMDNTVNVVPEPAIISVIDRIDSDDLYVACDGGYKGPTPYTKDFSGVKLSFKFGKPVGVSKVADDFELLVKRIQTLEKEVAVMGANETISIVHHNKHFPSSSLIKLRHSLFSKVDNQVHAESVPLEDDSEDTAENQAAQALDALQDTHVVNVPPFYDMHFMLLNPLTYRAHLEGAVAEIRFTLVHHVIGKGNNLKNVFTADVVDVVIIHGAPPRIVTPRRARVFAIHPSSPTKRPRQG